MAIEDSWREVTDQFLRDAARRLNSWPPDVQRVILAETQRRGQTPPPAVTADMLLTSVGQTKGLAGSDGLGMRALLLVTGSALLGVVYALYLSLLTGPRPPDIVRLVPIV